MPRGAGRSLLRARAQCGFGRSFGTDAPIVRRGHGCLGFTLLELIVVVALLGIVVAFAVLRVGPEQRRLLDDTAGQLLGAVSLVEQESILRRRPLGISVYRSGYRVDRIGTSGPSMEEDPLYRFRELPRGIEFLHAPEAGSAAGPPAFVMFPDGDAVLGEVTMADTRSGRILRLMPRDGRLAAIGDSP